MMTNVKSIQVTVGVYDIRAPKIKQRKKIRKNGYKIMQPKLLCLYMLCTEPEDVFCSNRRPLTGFSTSLKPSKLSEDPVSTMFLVSFSTSSENNFSITKVGRALPASPTWLFYLLFHLFAFAHVSRYVKVLLYQQMRTIVHTRTVQSQVYFGNKVVLSANCTKIVVPSSVIYTLYKMTCIFRSQYKKRSTIFRAYNFGLY